MAQWLMRVSRGHEMYCPRSGIYESEPWLGGTWGV